MQLSDHDLSQLDEEELLNLSEGDLRRLSIELLNDLKEARERLNQNSRNSSRPPSSEPPWEKEVVPDDTTDKKAEKPSTENTGEKAPQSPEEFDEVAQQAEQNEKGESRKPGKQLGAEGFGRQQTLAVTDYKEHFLEKCACCHQPLNSEIKKAYTAFETIDIEWADENFPGIRVTNTKHTYYEISCQCGHITRKEPNRSNPHSLLPNIANSEWRLVGPGLASLIISLAYRMRLSRERIREFLHDWLGLLVSVGTINNTIHESGAAAMPVEEELIEAIVDSNLLNVDETSWMEMTTFLWLWVFSTNTVTVFWIAHRTSELIDNILGHEYSGWLMSDGYAVYRKYLNRVRCWAHLIRKAEGLKEALNQEAHLFGLQTLVLMDVLMKAIREARKHPPDKPLMDKYIVQLSAYRLLCEQMKTSPHKKSRNLATEMLNDWEAIFCVLQFPHLPLTNNEAERALRHWVILRKISYGTRTSDGSRVFAILISVIETCRKRGQSPWLFLATVIQNGRSGRAVPKLPIAMGSE